MRFINFLWCMGAAGWINIMFGLQMWAVFSFLFILAYSFLQLIYILRTEYRTNYNGCEGNPNFCISQASIKDSWETVRSVGKIKHSFVIINVLLLNICACPGVTVQVIIYSQWSEKTAIITSWISIVLAVLSIWILFIDHKHLER